MKDQEIVLNQVESTLRQLLLDVVDFIKTHPTSSLQEASHVPVPDELAKAPLELRWTGGWVRDKLLNVESKDIDVAINKMTGYQFGLRIKEYLETPGNEDKYDIPGVTKKAAKLYKIDANPDKSKHLETTTTKIFGLDIDLVNLRKETYTEDSRNPQVEFGTPEEDALRRDATINAMFYNIHTSQVEDYTKHGLEDLSHGIIRTPLEPRTTFLDDPLRVLRLIRFAVRYGYRIDQSSLESMASTDIHKAFMAKITRERVWQELEKMLKGPRPKAALKYIHELGLYNVIFVDPSRPDFYTPDLSDWPGVIEIMADLASADPSSPLHSLKTLILRNQGDAFLGWMIAAIIPWTDAPDAPPLKNGKPAPPMAATVAKEGLKTTSKIWELYTLSIAHMEQIRKAKDERINARDALGMLIRSWGSTWTLQLLYSMLFEIYNALTDCDNILKSYSTFLNTCNDLNLMDAYNFKPIIDGKQLSSALGTAPGTWMKPALEVVMRWQFGNPGITDASSAIEEVRAWKAANPHEEPPTKKQKKQGELTSALTSHFLRLTLRPLFAQTSHHNLTSTGRRNINADVIPQDTSGIFDEEIRPWKNKDTWALDLLEWVCKNLDEECVRREWGVLIPPVLTVLDDTDVRTKAKGCSFMKHLLNNTPPELLKNTGLTPVFAESLIGCTSYLPTLTLEDESILILNSAYPALLALSSAAYPPVSESIQSQEKIKFLTQVLRKCFLTGYRHAGDNVRIGEVLLLNLPPFLNDLGINTVVHLKALIPLLCDLLDDPFAPASPSLISATAAALKAVIANAWPRIGYYRAAILKGIGGLWLRLESDEETGRQFDRIKEQLKDLMVGLDASVKANDEFSEHRWREELESLLQADNRLAELFSSVHSADTKKRAE